MAPGMAPGLSLAVGMFGHIVLPLFWVCSIVLSFGAGWGLGKFQQQREF